MQLVSARKPANAPLLIGWIAILAVSTLWESGLQADTSEPLTNIIRQALLERLISRTADSSLRENQLTAADVRAILHDNFDPGLLASVMEITGTGFRSVPSGQAIETQVAILVLSYPDRKAVLIHDKKVGE